MVVVTAGNYDGKIGAVNKLTKQRVKLLIREEETGYIPIITNDIIQTTLLNM